MVARAVLPPSVSARERLRMLGHVDLGAAAEILTGEKLWSKQREIAREMSQYRAKVTVPSANGTGKFVRASSDVLTPTGWVRADSITPGDLVVGADGLPTRVVAVHPQGRQPIYRLHLDSGTTFDCGGPHLWAVDAFVSTGGKPRYQKRRMVVDTDWLIARYGGLGVKPNPQLRVSLPMVEPVRFAGTTPPTVDPYLVGVLLGDGGLTGSIPVLTTNDPEIVAAVHAAGYTTAAYGKYGHGIHGIKPELAALGMLGARSWEKAVPEAYLWGSPETRLAVLQGLMDTDGGFDGGPSFTSTSRKLAEQVQFLVRSLGGRARLVPRVTSYTHNGVKKQGRESYRVTIVAPFCPFRLERHASKWRAADAGRHKTYAYTVQSIERVDDDEAVCFTVDAPDGLFVGENLVVTHNSWLAARLALMFFEAYTPGTPCDTCGGPCKGGKVITTSSKFEHLRDNLWGELRTAFDRAKRRGLETPGRLILGDLRHEDGPNHFIIGQSASTAEGLQGHHSGHKLIIGDEATAIGDEVQLAITRLLATSDSRLLLIFNPTTPDTYAARMARSGRTKNIKITAWDVPTFTDEPIPPGANLITPDFLEDLKAQGMGPESFEWRTSVEAEFWDTGDDLLVPADMYDRCVVPRATLGGVRQLGVDLASYGSDECVIAVRDGDALVDLRTFPSMRMDTFFETHVRKAVEDHQPHYVVYDADGVGAGVIGYAEALQRYMPGGGEIIGFRGAKGVGNRFTNARSAWWWALRRRFEHGRIAVAVSDEKLRAQITDLHYTVTSAGEIRVETKAEMKKRGMSSPDRGDALCYAFAFSEELPRTTAPKPVSEVADFFGVSDRSEAAMWRRVIERREGALLQINPVTGVPDDF